MGQKTVTMKVILLFLLHSIICCSEEISQPITPRWEVRCSGLANDW